MAKVRMCVYQTRQIAKGNFVSEMVPGSVVREVTDEQAKLLIEKGKAVSVDAKPKRTKKPKIEKAVIEPTENAEGE